MAYPPALQVDSVTSGLLLIDCPNPEDMFTSQQSHMRGDITAKLYHYGNRKKEPGIKNLGLGSLSPYVPILI